MTERRRTNLEIGAEELWLWVSAIGRYLLVMFVLAVSIGWVTDLQIGVVRTIAAILVTIAFMFGFYWATKGDREEKVVAFIFALVLAAAGFAFWYHGGKELVGRILR